MRSKDIPSPQVLRQLLRYDPDTGKLFWCPRGIEWFNDSEVGAERSCNTWNFRYANREAFTATMNKGYKSGSVFYRNLLAHRVAWAMYHGIWPQEQIDHINGLRTDNRIVNLRAVSGQENMRNAKRPKNNTSGVIGVRWQPNAGKWRARIKVDNRTLHVGYFDNFDAAVAARKEAEAAHGFHKGHGRD